MRVVQFALLFGVACVSAAVAEHYGPVLTVHPDRRGKIANLPSAVRQKAIHDFEDAKLVGASTSVSSAGSSTITSSMFNLGKTILGAGVLSLPFGVAAVTDKFEGLYPATALLLIMGAISAYSFASIGRACEKHNARSFAEAWSKSVDPKTGGLLSFIILFKTLFACLVFSIIIGKSPNPC